MRPTVRTLMTPEVVTVHADATFKEVAETLIDNEISGVPVVGDDGRVLGVISEQDLAAQGAVPRAVLPRGLPAPRCAPACATG